MVTFLAVYNTYNTLTPKGEHWGWFSSNTAFFEVERGYAVIMMFSFGYLIFDEIAIRFFYTDPWADKMTS